MLSPFGKEVRKARIETSTTLSALASFLNVSVPFLSAVENGRKNVPSGWKHLIEDYFRQLGHPIDLAQSIALSARQINLTDLPSNQAHVLARLSAVDFENLPKTQVDELMKVIHKIEEEQIK